MHAPVSQTRHLVRRTSSASRHEAGGARRQKTAQTLRLTMEVLDEVGQPLALPTHAAVPLSLAGAAAPGAQKLLRAGGRYLLCALARRTLLPPCERHRRSREGA